MASQVLRLLLSLLALAGPAPFSHAQPDLRGIPRPLPSHPGNIFLEGEEVVIPMPRGRTNSWRVLDFDRAFLGEVHSGERQAGLGRLPIGFYRVENPANSNQWTSAGVIAQWPGPVPASSPISVDVAMAWFYPKDRMADAASLCALAGVNWVRDRMTWAELEPRRGEFAAATRYDEAAAIQSAAGLRVLQVNHSTPTWAGTNATRFPPDLRDTFRFHREMARRWAGRVQAFEPWNEADIERFGGHTGSEMAALQKAAWLGAKAGNPRAIVCQNVFAKHRRAQLEDLGDNGVAPYFDTFNLHHYEPLEAYPDLYARFRAVADGKPLWVSEAALPVKWSGSDSLKEPGEAEQRRQAEDVMKACVASLAQGTANFFQFVLPHYAEGQTQFGLLRPDLTPRPAYVAFAATARWLGEVEAVSREPTLVRRDYNQPAFWDRGELVESFVFRLSNRKGYVRVAWARTPEPLLISWGMGSNATLRTLLGARRDWRYWIRVHHAPVLGVFQGPFPDLQWDPRLMSLQPNLPSVPPVIPGWRPVDEAVKQWPPAARRRDELPPSPVVLQPQLPPNSIQLDRSAWRLQTNRVETVKACAYNFSDAPITTRVRVQGPPGWILPRTLPLNLPAGGRQEIPIEIDARQPTGATVERLQLETEMPGHLPAVLSFRVMTSHSQALADADPARGISVQSTHWFPRASGSGQATLEVRDGQVRVQSRPRGDDKWVYPALQLAPGERPPHGSEGLALSITRHEGEGQFRVVFEEDSGASYVADLTMGTVRGEPVEVFAAFEDAVFGQGWSPRDPNGRLDPEAIRWIKVGCNTRSETVRYDFQNLRWRRP